MGDSQLFYEIDVRRIKMRNNSHKALETHIFFFEVGISRHRTRSLIKYRFYPTLYPCFNR